MSDEHDILLAVWADVEQAPLGQQSNLLTPVGGMPVLRRTAKRIAAVDNVKARVVFCPTSQRAQIGPLLGDLAIDVVDIDEPLPAYWPGAQAARKWAKSCWRGGLMGACGFDEDLRTDVLTKLAKRYNAGAVLTVPAHAALIDADILKHQVEQYLVYRDKFDISFTQAPPGLTGAVFGVDLLSRLAEGRSLAGSTTGYNPERPLYDVIGHPCNVRLDPSITQTRARLLCDTRRSLVLIDRLLTDGVGQDISAEQVARWVAERGPEVLSRWPEEIEVELTTEHVAERSYRPIPPSARGPIDADRLVDRIAEVTDVCDDLLVCLGGFGEPARHPKFADIVTRLKQTGVWGLCLVTNGLFDERTAQTVVELPIDVVLVQVDVPDAELYRKITGYDGYQQAAGNVDALLHWRRQARRPIPLVVPEMIKTYDTMELMDAFYDAALRRYGAAVIRGYDDYAGQLDDLAVSSMAPLNRCPCRQLSSKMTILADGTVVLCDRDFQGCCPIGSLERDSLLDLWCSGALAQVRQAHAAGRYDVNDLCPSCRHWHRYG